jgi:hypothetical protein
MVEIVIGVRIDDDRYGLPGSIGLTDQRPARFRGRPIIGLADKHEQGNPAVPIAALQGSAAAGVKGDRLRERLSRPVPREVAQRVEHRRATVRPAEQVDGARLHVGARFQIERGGDGVVRALSRGPRHAVVGVALAVRVARAETVWKEHDESGIGQARGPVGMAR